jgi:hypothetical protein
MPHGPDRRSPPASTLGADAASPHDPDYDRCMHNSRIPRRRIILIAVSCAVYAAAIVIARRRGYNFGARTVVRCRRGHVFTTIWIPGASIKSLRLGWWRVQRCPIGGHWTLVSPVRTTTLSDTQRREADMHHDAWLP